MGTPSHNMHYRRRCYALLRFIVNNRYDTVSLRRIIIGLQYNRHSADFNVKCAACRIAPLFKSRRDFKSPVRCQSSRRAHRPVSAWQNAIAVATAAEKSRLRTENSRLKIYSLSSRQ